MTVLAEPSAWSQLQRGLRHLFSLPDMESTVGVLVLVSVVLTLVELSNWDSISAKWARLEMINDLMTYGFAGELRLRFLAAAQKRWFFREYWLGILSVLPLFRVFRTGSLRRLRRLFGVASRLAWHFPDVVRRGAIVCCGPWCLASAH